MGTIELPQSSNPITCLVLFSFHSILSVIQIFFIFYFFVIDALFLYILLLFFFYI